MQAERDAVDARSLVGRTLERVWMFPPAPVDAAWVDEFTTPIATTQAFLALSDGLLVGITPCEVKRADGGYPSLGLALQSCVQDAMSMTHSNGSDANRVPDEIPRWPERIGHAVAWVLHPCSEVRHVCNDSAV